MRVLVVVCLAFAASAHASPTIGALVDRDRRVVCSGTLLTRNVVLTAAHCVVRDGIVTWPYAFYVGDDIRLGGVFARVVTGAVHPDYDTFLHTNDFALLRIVGEAPGRFEEPRLAASIPAIDTELLAVGFGSGAVGPREITTRVITRTQASFRYTPGTCPGDSGGPLLARGAPTEPWQIVGVVSTGALGCGDAQAVAAAPARDWVAAAIEVVDPVGCRSGDGTCGIACAIGDGDCACASSDGACRLCDSIDDDCSTGCEANALCATSCLAPDPDCATHEVGSQCERDAECSTALCDLGVCRAPCDLTLPASCAPWDACVAHTNQVGETRAVCLSPTIVTGGCSTTTSSLPIGLALLWLLAMRRRDRTACNLNPIDKE